MCPTFVTSFYNFLDPRKKPSCRCPDVENMCTTIKRTAIKIVRATMEEIQYFLLKNKQIAHNVKILHLLRDPRGRLNSFASAFGLKNLINGSSAPTTACQRMMKDVVIRKELEKQFPDMFMEIHYEDIAANPIKMANRVYQFAFSEDAPDYVVQWLNMNTHNSSNKENVWGFPKTSRKNSTATSIAWKK